MVMICILLIFSGCTKEDEGKLTDDYHKNEEKKELLKYIQPVDNTVKSDYNQFIPDGWRILNIFSEEAVRGDLNKDEIKDLAFVVEEDTDEIDRKRKLIILFGNEDGSYKLAATSDECIRGIHEGGPMGDPLYNLEIERGSLLINHYGGGAWRWGDTFRFRYQDEAFYLIGATQQTFNTISEADSVILDINQITGDYILDTSDDKGEWTKEEGKREHKELIKLSEFDIRDTNQVFKY